MAKGKTNYTFTVNAPQQAIHNLMQSFLSANGYQPNNEGGVVYYKYYDGIWGNRFLEYYVNGNQLTILAYIGTFKKPCLLDNSMVAIASKQDYKNKLVPLFNAINELNMNGGVAQPQVQPQQMADYGQNMGQPMGSAPYTSVQTNQFANDVDKSKEKMAIAGFIISIVGLLLSCFGIYFGAVIIALEIYFAVSGLKTSKKGFSIATFVISGLSILIIIAEVILAVMLQ